MGADTIDMRRNDALPEHVGGGGWSVSTMAETDTDSITIIIALKNTDGTMEAHRVETDVSDMPNLPFLLARELAEGRALRKVFAQKGWIKERADV